MPPRATLIASILFLAVTAAAIVACYNTPPPPPPVEATPEATQAPPAVEENPEAAETPPPPWPVARLAEQDITPEPTATATPTPTPEPTPQLDFSRELPAGQLSDQPLEGDINAAPLPTRKTSMRIADQARRELLKHEPDDAIRTLGRALSIDASDPYVYFYLGRAYLMKHNYEEAMTFWERAAISFRDNPKWLSEVLSFEGAVKERMGDTEEARKDYGRAIKLSPDNQLANDGYGRVGPPPPPPDSEPKEPAEAEPPPEEAEPPPPPGAEEPAPAEEPMPSEVPTPPAEPPGETN